MGDSERSPRRLIAVFESPVTEMLFRFGVELGFRTALVEPDPTRPVGLNIGSRTPAEIAVATLAGLIADRNQRPGGFEF